MVIGSEHDITCVLKKDIDDVWRGRWLRHEGMPISVIKHRGQVIIDSIEDKKLIGVEIVPTIPFWEINSSSFSFIFVNRIN